MMVQNRAHGRCTPQWSDGRHNRTCTGCLCPGFPNLNHPKLLTPLTKLFPIIALKASLKAAEDVQSFSNRKAIRGSRSKVTEQ